MEEILKDGTPLALHQLDQDGFKQGIVCRHKLMCPWNGFLNNPKNNITGIGRESFVHIKC